MPRSLADRDVVAGKADMGQSLSNAMIRAILADVPKGGAKRLKASLIASMIVYLSVAGKGVAKRLKALLKATIRLFRFEFQDSTLCVIDHWLERLSSVRVTVSPQQGFRRIHPTPPFSGVYCNDKVYYWLLKISSFVSSTVVLTNSPRTAAVSQHRCFSALCPAIRLSV